MPERERPYWIDQLREKHECFPYDAARRMSIKVAGEAYSVLVLEYLPQMEVRAATRQNDLLFVTVVIDEMFFDEPVGFVMIARRQEDGDYTTVVWHEMYPHAVERLGLAGKDNGNLAPNEGG